MPAVKCGVDGCGAVLQPLWKPDPADRDTWAYPECDVCFGPACAKHLKEIEGTLVCDRCRREREAQRTASLIDLGTDALFRPR